MKNSFIRSYAVALLFGTAAIGNAQSRITITGGPGSDSSGAPAPPTDVVAGSVTSGVSEERVRQIVREELQRAGILPPPGMYTGPVGVSPNPFSPPRPAIPGTNINVGSIPTGGLAGVALGGSNAVGIATPSGSVLTPSTVARPTTTGPTGPGGSVGVISGGSSAVGVATPSGAGASRSATTSPTTSGARP